ncbi:MAG: C_GCAxxG_C_C family protein [Chloroflexi bacterium]|nr:C_GCAxxG_C_C family protein [Chloroflexota bacterium]
MSNKEEAVSSFKSGFNCAEAIVSVYGPEPGLPRETALKIACGLGAGMSKLGGGVCGAASGMFLVIGLKYGRTDPNDATAKENVYDLVRESAQRFKEKNGSIYCAGLLGCDISTPEGLRYAKENGLVSKLCPKFVADAADILDEIT